MTALVVRTFNALYIYLDIAWLLLFALILVARRRYLALIAGLAGGVLYFVVDYGIFYLALGTRTISGASPFWLLLWLSMSYGFTNMAWIWLLLDRDGNAVEWSALPIIAWIAVALLSQNLGAHLPLTTIERGTTDYHGVMALLLCTGYFYLIWRNLAAKPGHKVGILRLLAIGLGVQFSWELVLLLTSIRPAGVIPLLVNSLIETNMGMPYLYLIHRAVSGRMDEDLAHRASNPARS